jgi:ketosteroid isomerase-like protein
MRLMFDTMDAYDRGDFDRLAEIYAEDAQWRNANPNGPHCRNRDDIFTMFRQRKDAGIRIGFDELRSAPSQVRLTARGRRLRRRCQQVPVVDPGRSSAQH